MEENSSVFSYLGEDMIQQQLAEISNSIQLGETGRSLSIHLNLSQNAIKPVSLKLSLLMNNASAYRHHIYLISTDVLDILDILDIFYILEI
jgi:hypothetical protein